MKKILSTLVLSAILISFCSAQTFKSVILENRTGPSAEFSPDMEEMYYGSSYYSQTLTETFLDIFIDLWILDTILITFDDYPYHDGAYMQFENLIDGGSGSENKVSQFYRFAVDTSFFYFPDHMAGNETRIEGLIWKFFGPIFQIDTMIPLNRQDDSGKPTYFSSIDTSLQLGFQMSIIQTNPISLYWALCWQRIQYADIPTLNGYSLQLIARSYPMDPILIEWRGTLAALMKDGEEYSSELNWESHLEVGMMMKGPLEVFAAWRYISYPGLGFVSHGIELGARYHF